MNPTLEKKAKQLTRSIVVLLFAFSLQLSLAFAQTNQASQAMRPTPSATEGPYWKSGSPARDTLYQKNDPGERIEVSGNVLDRSGKSISGVKIDIWQTDARGTYDNTGFAYRGHVLTDALGQYRFKTVKPGEYPSRTPHIHIKLSTPGGKNLTTQLYLPDFSERNQQDSLYDEQLVISWISGNQARFDFVLR